MHVDRHGGPAAVHTADTLNIRRAALMANHLYREAGDLPSPNGLRPEQKYLAVVTATVDREVDPAIITSAIAQLNARWECGTATLEGSHSIRLQRER